MASWILTDGKNYVMEDPFRQGIYLPTTSPVQAKHFAYKQAKKLLQTSRKSLAWVKNYQMVNDETGEVDKTTKYYLGNGGAYIGEHDIEFDENIIDLICKESESIMGLAGWNMSELMKYRSSLDQVLSKYDSAESDICHALQKYKEDNNGKKPQAHKMSKVAYLLDELRDKRKHVKQCIDYVEVMKSAITHSYSLEKLKIEITKAKHTPYKARTEYYEMVLNILE